MKISSFFFLIIICILIITGIWRIAYNGQSRLPNRLKTETIQSSVKIQWGNNNTAEIHSDSFSDALFGLGYVQGQLNGWTIALWRQASLGKLTDWYGAEVIEADRLIRKLELPEIAQISYSRLNPKEANLIASFGAGIQVAWQDVDHMHEFFLQNIIPEPWEPWHTLAIERLIAWMSSASEPVCNLGVSTCTAIENLRSILLLYGLESSSTWTVSTSRGPLLYQRHILGNGVSPIFQEVVIRVSNELEFHGASLLGTPFFPGGKTEQQAWAILLHSPKTSRPVHTDSMQMTRFVFPEREEIVSYQRSDSTFSTPESQHELVWNGFRSETDVRAWFALLHNHSLPFRIWRGDGLLVRSDSSKFVLGNPEFILTTSDSGLVVSNDSLIHYTMHYLNNLDPNSENPTEWITDTRSLWLAETLPQRLDSLNTPAGASTMTQSVVAYLRNWDYDFGEQSIGATIYNEWATSEKGISKETLYDIVDDLSQKYGPNPSQWIWGQVYTDTSWLSFRGLSDNKIFAPFVSPVVGHESTMIWGGARAAATPATFEMWTWIEPGSAYIIRRRNLDLSQPLGRYVSDKSGRSVFLLPAPHHKTTLLLPNDS